MLVEPVMVAPPGVAVNIQLLVGRPLSEAEPVVTTQPGCVTASTTGADGVEGCAGITALPDAGEVQPLESSVTVNV